MTVDFEAELGATSSALKETLKHEYGNYLRLIEFFLSGRMTKEELEGGLRSILGTELHPYDLHNKYVGLILERVAAAESVALVECHHHSYHPELVGDEVEWEESASLGLAEIPISTVDQAVFEEAAKRTPVEIPYLKEDSELSEKLRVEVLAVEKSLGRPVLCKFARALPDMVSLRVLIGAWMRAYELDAGSLDDEHIAVISQGLVDYIKGVLEKAYQRECLVQARHDNIAITVGSLLSVIDQEGINPYFEAS